MAGIATVGNAIKAVQRTQQAILEKVGMADKTDDDQCPEIDTHHMLDEQLRKLYRHVDVYMRRLNAVAEAADDVAEDFADIFEQPAMRECASLYAQAQKQIRAEEISVLGQMLHQHIFKPIRQEVEGRKDIEKRIEERKRHRLDFDAYRRKVNAAINAEPHNREQYEKHLQAARTSYDKRSQEVLREVARLNQHRFKLLSSAILTLMAAQGHFHQSCHQKFADNSNSCIGFFRRSSVADPAMLDMWSRLQGEADILARKIKARNSVQRPETDSTLSHKPDTDQPTTLSSLQSALAMRAPSNGEPRPTHNVATGSPPDLMAPNDSSARTLQSRTAGSPPDLMGNMGGDSNLIGGTEHPSKGKPTLPPDVCGHPSMQHAATMSTLHAHTISKPNGMHDQMDLLNLGGFDHPSNLQMNQEDEWTSMQGAPSTEKRHSFDMMGFDDGGSKSIQQVGSGGLLNQGGDLMNIGTKARASLIDWSDEPSLMGALSFEAQAGRPTRQGGHPDRQQLANARMANQQAAIDKKVQDLRDRDQRENIEREQRLEIERRVTASIQKWKQEKTNIRALIASLDEVLWEGCEWEAIPLSKLLTNADVKRAFRTVSLKIHPDKIKSDHGIGVQERVVAQHVFDAIKEAFDVFRQQGG